MTTVRLRLFAAAREAAGRAETWLDAVTVGDLLDASCAAYGQEFAAVLATARVWVNGEEPSDGRATPLRDGDEVAVLPPVSGGAASEVSDAQLEELGLYDPGGEHARERLELLRYLLGLGATTAELQEAGDELPVLASDLALRPGGERLTLTEVAERAGASVELASRVWRVSGLPEPGPQDRVCTEADVDVLQIFVAGRELLGEEAVLQIGRVVGSAVARIADAARSVFFVHLAAPSLAEDAVGLALARANAEAVALVPGLVRALDVTLRHHFELERRPIEVLSGARRGYDSQRLTVGFVDLVGSTALAQQLSIGELGAALGQFDALADDVVRASGGRLVKLIGDEAMFVVGESGAGCEIALDLVDELAAHPVLPDARGALAAGEVLTREGDFFGPVVNLAARAAKLADPGGILASDEVRRTADGFGFSSIGSRALRGIDATVTLYRVERRS